MIDYWISAVEEALDRVEVELNTEDIETMAQVISDAAAAYGECSGEQAATRGLESHTERELRELKEKEEDRLSWEGSTIPCMDCGTTGSIPDALGSRYNVCTICDGQGRVGR